MQHGSLNRRHCVTGLVAAIVALASTGSSAQQLDLIADFEQWPGVSQLITYRDRIWFVNSEPFKDSNVADIYSYSIEEGTVRYERSLFSQDAGDPVIFNGLLYWPFEDPRRSAGTGEYAVTDGVNWQWRVMQSGSVMHVHAMNVCDGDLVATTGSWTGQLHRLASSESGNSLSTEPDVEPNAENYNEGSDKPKQGINEQSNVRQVEQHNEQKWEVQYDYPAAEDSFSRLVSVSPFGDSCIVGASAKRKDESKLFSIEGDTRTAIEGWPSSDRVESLKQHQGSLFAFSDAGGVRQLLRYDGSQVHEVTLPSTHRPRALHSDGGNLWLATRDLDEDTPPGALWKYDNEGKFAIVQELAQAPIALGSHNGMVAIGTHSTSGGGLWLYKDSSLEQTSVEASSGVLQTDKLQANNKRVELDPELVRSLYDELLELINDPENAEDHASVLRNNLGRHPQINAPEFGAAITRLLSTPIEGDPITMFTGRSIRFEDLVHWYLTTALAINGHGYIEPTFINSAEELVAPDSGKAFDPSIAAIVASGWLQQNDEETLAALVTRLNNEKDPLWVKADVIGALTTLTKENFGYDVERWNKWWEKR